MELTVKTAPCEKYTTAGIFGTGMKIEKSKLVSGANLFPWGVIEEITIKAQHLFHNFQGVNSTLTFCQEE